MVALVLAASCVDAGIPELPPLPDPQLPADEMVVAIAAGFSSTCALVEAGRAYCWCDNRFGEIGDGTDSVRTSPVPVLQDSLFATIIGTRGTSRTCSITSSGTAYCWGYNVNGELGDSTLTDAWRPVAVVGEIRFLDIATSYHTCGVALDNVAYCWAGGVVTPNGLGPRPVPTAVRFKSITTGLGFTCGLDLAGSAWCWGLGAMTGTASSPQSTLDTPQAVATPQHFQSISAAEEHTCALTAAGVAYCWGKINGAFAPIDTVPIRLDGLPPLKQVVGGRSQSCVLTIDGRAYCGDLLGSLAPQADRLRFASLSVGLDYACGHTPGGAAYCWSNLGFGYLGDGGTNHPQGAIVRVIIPSAGP